MNNNIYIDQLEKKYPTYLQSLILNKDFEPILLRGGKNKPVSAIDLHVAIQLFQQYEKNEIRKGWRITWQEWNTKKLGRQQWPAEVWVDTEADYLALIKKENEIILYKRLLTQLLQWNAGICDCLLRKPMAVLEYKNEWTGICSVVDFLISNDVNGYYLRNLPVPVHTKFIEQYKSIISYLLRHIAPERFNFMDESFEKSIGLKLKPSVFYIRWLDYLLADKYCNGMEISGLTVDTLKNVNWQAKIVFLVENETTLYMLPELPGSLAICSKGYALHELTEIPLLNNARLIYWGDMDEDGYAILSICRKLYPHTQSILMNDECMQSHPGELDIQPSRYRKEIPGLEISERTAFEKLRQANGRIEQEKLKHTYILSEIQRLR